MLVMVTLSLAMSIADAKLCSKLLDVPVQLRQ